MKIGYARVSTDDQKLDLQMDALRAAGCGDNIFQDTGISGSTMDRVGLDGALASLKAGDVLVVYKLDRLGRSLEHLISAVKDLDDRGVGFQSISEGFDTTTPAGKMIFHVIGALAQFERELIRERVMAGLDAAKARGVKLGRKYTIPAETVAEAIRLHGSGSSYGQIGALLGMSRASAHRVVRRHVAGQRPAAEVTAATQR
jgi:DNA invertase Pin-like site-specific DNA recombinase